MANLIFDPTHTWTADDPSGLAVGTVGETKDGRQFVVVDPAVEVNATIAVRIDHTGAATIAAPGAGNKGDRIGICNTRIPAAERGWAQRIGPSVGRANAGIDASMDLDIAAGGEVDDATQTNGDVTGLYSTGSGSANGPVNIYLHSPYYT